MCASTMLSLTFRNFLKAHVPCSREVEMYRVVALPKLKAHASLHRVPNPIVSFGPSFEKFPESPHAALMRIFLGHLPFHSYEIPHAVLV
jgi:hypothetical protein